MQAPWWWSKTETRRSDIYVYFNVNFNVFLKIKKWIFWWVNSTCIRMRGATIKIETKCVYYAVRIQSLNTTELNFRLENLMFILRKCLKKYFWRILMSLNNSKCLHDTWKLSVMLVLVTYCNMYNTNNDMNLHYFSGELRNAGRRKL